MKRKISIIKVGIDDVTPDAVDWTDIEYEGGAYTATYQQITGISSDITLNLSFGGSVIILYKIDTVEPFYTATITDPPSSFGFIEYNNNDDIVLNNAEYLSFTCGFGGSNESGTITVINISDNNTVLDTFDYYVSAIGPPP
jgi:hypothetical protein